MQLLQDNVVPLVIEALERESRTSQYIDDPVLWAKEYLGYTLWSKQREVAYSVRDNKSTAVKAGHGVGKSLLAAVLIAWWIDVHPLHSAYFFTTAPSTAQVSSVIGRELRKIVALSKQRYADGLVDHPLPGHIVSPNTWKTESGHELGLGRKPPDHTTDDAVQGIHGQYILAIGDEACGLTESMIDALSNITSNDTSRRLLIGNPTNPSSHFGKIFKEDTGAWSLHSISVLDSPNFTDEKHEMPEDALAQLTGPSYVEDKKLEYGEDSARYRARILGEFAYDMGDALITDREISVARDTVIDANVRPVLGVDVARFGQDKSVVYSNTGGKIRFEGAWEKEDLTFTAQRVHEIAMRVGASEVRVDGHGIGGGVIDNLINYHNGHETYTIIEMLGGGASPDRKQWHNARAFWWDKFRADMFDGKIDLDPEDDSLIDELMMVEYKYSTASNALLLESKDDMRKRGAKSPDYADAAIYAAADMSAVVGDPLQDFQVGDKLTYDLYDLEEAAAWQTALPW